MARYILLYILFVVHPICLGLSNTKLSLTYCGPKRYSLYLLGYGQTHVYMQIHTFILLYATYKHILCKNNIEVAVMTNDTSYVSWTKPQQ